MKPNNALQVLYDERLVGMLAMTADHKAAFQYSEEWLEHGFPISPFSLPLKIRYLCRIRIILMDFLEYLRIACQMAGEDYW